MIIIRTRHRIKSTSLLDMNHRYIKGILSAPKVSWEVNLYLVLRPFHREWSLGVEANNLQWSVACIVFSQFLRSCHTSSRLPCVDSLFLFICGNSHMSQVSSCNSMILRVRAQSIRAIGCHHSCVIHRDLLLTSPSVGCCQLVTSFANALGVFVLFQNSEFHLVWSNGSIAQAPLRCRHPHLHYLVLIVLLLPLFHGFSPVYITEHIPKYCSIENFIKLPFQWVLIHLNRSPNEGAMAILFPLLHAVQKISERATFGNSAIPACRNLRLTWFLIRWKHNFMGLLNIQRYPVVLPWGCAEIDGNIISCELIRIYMLMTLILWSSGRYVASPSALSHLHCWTSE
jgi:hypothetical protein